MARINDNLFTTLSVELVKGGLSQFEGLLETRLGQVRICFSAAGLVGLVFSEVKTPVDSGMTGLRGGFLEWLECFERASPEEKWRALNLSGTPFQRSVWRALLEIPYGTTTSYAAIAAAVGRPRAFRAVGSALGANPVSILVPCHRVVPRAGGTGNYLWGVDRKRALLDAEQESGSDLQSIFK